MNCGQNVYIVYKPAVFVKRTCRNRAIKEKILHQNAGFVVEHTGFEPLTSTMQMSRANKAGIYTPRGVKTACSPSSKWFGLVEIIDSD